MSNQRGVVIVGGGVAGLMTAYFLQQQNAALPTNKQLSVTLIDDGDASVVNASRGNAGAISPYGKTPFSNPANFRRLVGLGFKGKSPVAIKNYFNTSMWQWIYHFLRSVNARSTAQTVQLWEQYGEDVLAVYRQLSRVLPNFNYQDSGLLILYLQNEHKQFLKKQQTIRQDADMTLVRGGEVQDWFSLASDEVIGGFLMKRNAWMNPHAFIDHFTAYLKQDSNTRFVSGRVTEVVPEVSGDFTVVYREQQSNQQQPAQSAKNSQLKEIKTDNLVMATGVDTGLLVPLNRRLLQTPAKGYHFDIRMDKSLLPNVSCILNGAFVFLSPQQVHMRITGKLELGARAGGEQAALRSIMKLMSPYVTPFEYEVLDSWYGYRPLTPNDRPIFGRDLYHRNLIHANGLGWQGNTFSPILGREIANLIVKDLDNQQSEVVKAFSGLYTRH